MSLVLHSFKFRAARQLRLPEFLLTTEGNPRIVVGSWRNPIHYVDGRHFSLFRTLLRMLRIIGVSFEHFLSRACEASRRTNQIPMRVPQVLPRSFS